jgi:hypothetical protein
LISKDEDTVDYDSKDEFLRTVKHEYVDYINTSKDDFINRFIDEYRRVMNMCLNELWNKNYCYEIKGKSFNFHLKHRIFNGGIPKYLAVSKFNCLKHYNGLLSGRMISNVINQLAGILYGEYKSSKALKHRFERPTVTNVNPLIPPKHVQIIDNTNDDSIFENYVLLVNLTSKRNQNIIIPIKTHRMDDHYNGKGEHMKSILLTKSAVNYLYKMKGDKTANELKSVVIGADMGIRKIVTLSDGQITPNTNSQGITMNDLTEKLKRKKKNSKGYKRGIK